MLTKYERKTKMLTKYELARNIITAVYGLKKYPDENIPIWARRIKKQMRHKKEWLEELNESAVIILQERKTNNI